MNERRAVLGVRAGLTRRAALVAGALPLLGCEARPPPVTGGFAGADPQRGHRLRETPAREGAPPAPGAGSATPPQRASSASAPPERRVHTVVAGAGVAGLAAARALRLRGVDDFVVLELEDQPGGNARAGQLGGLPCPLGAHYLPVPGDDAHEVQDLLEELGLRQRVAGRWRYDERHLCHSPQERLYFRGEWQDGLLPMEGVAAATLAQYRRFAQAVARIQRAARFAMPAQRAPFAALHATLDAQRMDHWLDAQQLDDPHLRWYLDYCCRDDYGASLSAVSAWAGIHYFASRHGFQAPGDDSADTDARDAVLTWPEGNGWLTQRLAAPLGERLHTGWLVRRIAPQRQGVSVEALHLPSGQAARWRADHCIVALPMMVAAKVLDPVPPALQAAMAGLRYAPWVVVNLQLSAPLRDRPGAPPSWDNVLYGSAGLGYVDASHQRLDPRPGPTVLSWYLPLGDRPEARTALLQQPWTHWRDQAVAELAPAHADLPGLLQRVEVARYGHAMSVPVPGRLRTLHDTGRADHGALRFAHADWSGYSVFEEAFTRGHLAAQGLKAPRR